MPASVAQMLIAQRGRDDPPWDSETEATRWQVSRRT